MSILQELLGLYEAKDHLGEREYSTWSGWRAACKKANPDVWFEGDKDIAQAMVGPKPYKHGETKAIGEWDGDKGSVFNITESLSKASLIKSFDHFGSKEENPHGYAELSQALKYLGADLKKDKVHSIDADGFAEDFKDKAADLGMEETEWPDEHDAIQAGFKRLGKKTGTTYLMKDDTVLLISDDVPPTFFIKEGVELTEAVLDGEHLREDLTEGKGPFGIKMGGVSTEELHFGFEDRANATKADRALKAAGIKFTRDSNGGIFYFNFESKADMKKAIKVAEQVIDKSEESEW